MNNLDSSWPIERRPAEVMAEVRQRARRRRARNLTAMASIVLVLVGSLAVVASDGGDGSESLRTVDEPQQPSTEDSARAEVEDPDDDGDDDAEEHEASADPAQDASDEEVPSSSTTMSTTTTSQAEPTAGREPDVGVTSSEIVLGHVSTAGRTPGVAAGARAIVAYQNSRGGVWGRQLRLEVADDLGSADAHSRFTADLAARSFALMGSSSFVDDAGVQALEGVPDVGRSLGSRRRATPSNFSPQPYDPGAASTAGFSWFAERHADAVKAVGTLYFDEPSSVEVHKSHLGVAEAAGWRFAYQRAVQVSEVDYTADVLRMRQAGVRTVYLVAISPPAARRLAAAMAQQNFRPDLFIAEGGAPFADPTGSAIDGIHDVATTTVADASIEEVALFRQWLERVAPGQEPDSHAAYAWASGRLLFGAMDATGPLASRAAVIDHLQGVESFSAGDLLAPATPGSGQPPICRFITVHEAGAPRRVEPGGLFHCEGTIYRR